MKSKTAQYTSTQALCICTIKSIPNDGVEVTSARTLYSRQRFPLGIIQEYSFR